MKKTIITVMALCLGVAACGAESEYTLTSTTTGSVTSNSSRYGFTFDFGASGAYSLSEGTTAIGTNDSLASIKITLGSGVTEATAESVKLAVYSISPKNWNSIYDFTSYEGMSATGVYTAESSGNTVTFDLSGIDLQPSDGLYAFMIVGSSTTDAVLTTGVTETTSLADVYFASSSKSSLKFAFASSTGAWNNVKATNTDVKKWNTKVTPVATYTFSEVVPEPATATLSLLALAGLAARRRRK